MDEVSVVGLSGVHRKTRLLSAVRDQIAVDQAKFQNLLQALRKEPPLVPDGFNHNVFFQYLW